MFQVEDGVLVPIGINTDVVYLGEEFVFVDVRDEDTLEASDIVYTKCVGGLAMLCKKSVDHRNYVFYTPVKKSEMPHLTVSVLNEYIKDLGGNRVQKRPM